MTRLPLGILPIFLLFLVSVPLTGCKVGPNYLGADMDVPDYWHQGVQRDLGSRGSQLDDWWEGFKDPTLNKLIARAREANPGLKIALARVNEARAQRGVAQSQLFPSFNAGGDYVRQRRSEPLLLPGQGNPSNFFSMGFDAGWEIDVFGGTRRLVEAADASIQSAEESYRDALISLYAEVALNYMEVRTLEERLRLLRANIARQKESEGITIDRFKAELVGEIDVTQAKSNTYSSEALVPLYESQQRLAENRLAALLGGFPGSVDDLLGRRSGIPLPHGSFGYGLPADLVRSRPDIRVAERNLAAQTALIGVATSELYPKFTLFGDLGWDGIDGSDWLTSSSRAWSFGPSFRWNLFSAGRVKQSIAVEEARAEQAYYAYETTVLDAVGEVETALVAIVKERQRLGKLNLAVDQNELTVEKIGESYKAGLVDFQNVLDAERSLLTAQDDAATSRGDVAKFYIVLYKALGGGAPPPEAEEAPQAEQIK